MAETTEKKKRTQVPRTKMPEQEPRVRAKNFDEVPFGYTEEMAKLEASRCLQCKKPSCVAGCPVSVDIPGFVAEILEGDYLGAARKLKEMNSLPAVCGRVCPQEDQCEKLYVERRGSLPRSAAWSGSPPISRGRPGPSPCPRSLLPRGKKWRW